MTSSSISLPAGSVVLIATWFVQAGKMPQALEALEQLAQATRREPGNLLYLPYVTPEEPDVVRIFEVYVDEAALEAHSASAHFAEFGTDLAFPLLVGRTRTIASTL